MATISLIEKMNKEQNFKMTVIFLKPFVFMKHVVCPVNLTVVRVYHATFKNSNLEVNNT